MSKNQDVILAVLTGWYPGWASTPNIQYLAKRDGHTFDLSEHGISMSVTPLVQAGVIERRVGGRGANRRTQYRLRVDTWSSASRQHYIDTGEYLPITETKEA